MPLRSEGHCGVGRGLSELHWVWCNGRGPHDKLRQVPQGSSPGFECAGSDSDRRVPAELGQESQASSCVEEWNSACLSSCSRSDRPLVELCVEPAVLSGRCMGVSVPLRFLPSYTGLPSKRYPAFRFLSRADQEIRVFRHVAPPTSLRLEFLLETDLNLRCTRKVGNPFRQSK